MARPMMKNFPMNFFCSPPSQTHQLTDTKGLLNGPGQNNCFLNCAVQVSAETVPNPEVTLDASHVVLESKLNIQLTIVPNWSVNCHSSLEYNTLFMFELKVKCISHSCSRGPPLHLGDNFSAIINELEAQLCLFRRIFGEIFESVPRCFEP